MLLASRLGRILAQKDTAVKILNKFIHYNANQPKTIVIQALRKQPVFTNLKFFRNYSKNTKNFQTNAEKNDSKNFFWYSLSGFVIMVGASYAAVPLFKAFCESQGIDLKNDFRDIKLEDLKEKLMSMKRDENRSIKVKFDASTSSDLLWKFKPCQDEISLVPGETALAFFKAKNLTNRSIVGIATYTILPFDAGLYFNKIQCFCFEEQRLDPNEEIDMPVFFYIDEEFSKDPKLKDVHEIYLAYTFFESKGDKEDVNLHQLSKPYEAK